MAAIFTNKYTIYGYMRYENFEIYISSEWKKNKNVEDESWKLKGDRQRQNTNKNEYVWDGIVH